LKDVFNLEGVRVAKQGVEILRGIDWRVPEGRISIILGPSGSGKTSLLRLLNRLDEPTSGRIQYGGNAIDSYEVYRLRREVGMVFQRPELFEGTVRENLLFGSDLHKINVNTDNILSLVALENDMLDRDVSTLSGGQAQKVSIGRSVAVGPRVLLMDEPTSGLDPTATLQIETLVRRLVETLGLTCIFVTHLIEQARRVGDRAIVIMDGQKVEEGHIPDMLTSPRDSRTHKFIRGELT
jgi:putative ABC transport system ATP-binding protein